MVSLHSISAAPTVCVCVVVFKKMIIVIVVTCLHVLRDGSDVVPREHSGLPVTRPLPPVRVRVVQNLHEISTSEPEFTVLLRVEIEQSLHIGRVLQHTHTHTLLTLY